MNAIDLDRVKTIANFLESQMILEGVPPHGLVQINNEEAAVIVDTLREYALREMALGNQQAYEWEQLRSFYRKHALGPKREPPCLICERRLPATKIRPRELPHICVCDICRARALTSDIVVSTDPATGRALAVSRVDEDGQILSVLWQLRAEAIKREEKVHDFDD
jgi:hypothetical protein